MPRRETIKSNQLVSVRKKIRAFIIKPEGLFVSLAGIFGILFVFVTPPIQVYDERAHFFQAYAFSNLDLRPQKQEYLGRQHYGPELPQSVFVAGEVFIANTAGNADIKFNKGLYREYIRQPLNPEVKDHRELGTGYSPVVYAPQAIGITIGKIFESSPLVMIWLGRLLNLIAWIALVYISIRLIPFAKWALVVIALNPMAVFLSASLSADVMTVGLGLLFVSLVLSVIISKRPLSPVKLVGIISLSSALALTKPTNAIFSLLVFAIPWKKFTSKKKYLIAGLACVLVAFTAAFAWNQVVAEANDFNAQIQAQGRIIDPGKQLSGILSEPLDYIKKLVLNYVIVPDGFGGNLTLTSFVGALGWGETVIPLWAIFAYFVVLLFAFMHTAGRGPTLPRMAKIIFALIFVAFCGGNITAMYLYFTGVGQDAILGVQGRYFIPGTILIAALFTSRRKLVGLNKESSMVPIVGVFTSLILLTALLTVFIRYYGI